MVSWDEQINHVPQLKNGNIIKANFDSDDVCGPVKIKKGRYYLIIGSQENLLSSPTHKHPLVYDIVVCSKTGKPRKTNHRYSAYTIDKEIESGTKWTLIR